MEYKELMETLRSGDLESLCIDELAPLRGCEQNPVHHPEGDAWTHTKAVVENGRKVLDIVGIDDDVFLLVCLLHDVGKPVVTTVHPEKGIVAYKHGKAGVELAKAFLERVGAPAEVIEKVLPMVDVHMQVHTMNEDASLKSWRKLDKKFPLLLLGIFGRCDSFAKAPCENPMQGEHPGSELVWSKNEMLRQQA